MIGESNAVCTSAIMPALSPSAVRCHAAPTDWMALPALESILLIQQQHERAVCKRTESDGSRGRIHAARHAIALEVWTNQNYQFVYF